MKDTDSRRSISLALQGGGAWGAFTWGVLDHLLSRRSITIDQISGTSAGAINGAIVCSELSRGSARSAREALESFWRSVSAPSSGALMQLMLGPVGTMLSRRLGEWMWASGALSPYQANPLDVNPLRDAIGKHVDIDALRSASGPQLYVTATSVRTGLPRIFGSADMSVDALMASACLPHLFRAVEIDGEAYWDGGYCGNPTIWPLVRHGAARDIVLVQLAPDERPQLPRGSAEIRHRVGEIVFASSLVAEMQAIHAMRELIRRDGNGSRFGDLRLHRIGPPKESALAASDAALERSWSWLTQLRDEGRRAARAFLHRCGTRIGVESTLNIAQVFIAGRKPKLRLRPTVEPDRQPAQSQAAPRGAGTAADAA
ncbi:MAG TPA: patatin-like phospholipase family protein [Burkholderiaceae bacterium]|nr:patatin-like phospholipase family protein [Burkholderiaceae bacterium]